MSLVFRETHVPEPLEHMDKLKKETADLMAVDMNALTPEEGQRYDKKLIELLRKVKLYVQHVHRLEPGVLRPPTPTR